MTPSLWDVLNGLALSAALLTIFVAGSRRLRRPAFLIFCLFALTAFAWHAGCWYHQFDCPVIGQATALAQG